MSEGLSKLSDAHLHLPDVTLVAVTSVNIGATITAILQSARLVRFGEVKLLTSLETAGLPPSVQCVQIAPLTSASHYSKFMLNELVNHVSTSHCLVVQWDGYVMRPERWKPEFLEYDYIGARWPHFSDNRTVGNGGFSLRSRQLLEACGNEGFQTYHPEDVAIGRLNRAFLEGRGLRFAPAAIADAFSTERAGDIKESFGFHGVWHLPRILGAEEFFEVYLALDERRSLAPDFFLLLKQLVGGGGGLARAAKLIWDRLFGVISSKKRPRRKVRP